MAIADLAAAELYGIDLRLTDGGDLAISPSGDLVPCVGATNAAQALVIRLRTPRASLPLHPNYGSGLLQLVGSRSRDAALVAAQANGDLRAALDQDRRFVGIQDVTVTEAGTAVGVSCSLLLAGGETLTAQDIGMPRTDELAIDVPDLVDVAALDDIVNLADLVAGVDPDDPDYGDPVDYSQLLDVEDFPDPVETA